METTPFHYEELAPPPELAPMVHCLWTQRADEVRVQRVVPDGCVDLTWITDGSQTRAEIAGPDTCVHFGPMDAGTEIAGVRFRPGVAAGLLGLPLHVLRDERVPLAEAWGSAAAELTDRIADASAPDAAVVVAAAGVREQLARLPGPAGLAAADGWRGSGPQLAAAIAGRSGPGTVRQLAAELGMSERQLHRRCLVAFGYGPKMLQRVLRFQAALRAARRGHRLADVAGGTGYADQAHLSREVRELAGVTLSDLLAGCRGRAAAARPSGVLRTDMIAPRHTI
jgi:AraC-like DNA-binding protein